MKLGTEKKGEVIALVVLLVIASLMLWRSLAPAGPPAAPVPTAARLRAGNAAVPRRVGQLDPTLHLKKLEQLRAIHYSGSGRNLFRFGPAPAEVVAPVHRSTSAAERAAAARPAVPAGPPPPPPIPLRFYGFAQASGQPEKIFMQMGTDNYVVSQGDTIEHRYLIENIGKVSVRVKDLQTQSEQELPLQQG